MGLGWNLLQRLVRGLIPAKLQFYTLGTSL